MFASRNLIRSCVSTCCFTILTASVSAAEPPKVGEEAKDFALKTVTGETEKLSEIAKKGPVVILVLRGYPGYQCPICNRQVGEFVSKAKEFADDHTQIVMIYPGPADKLAAHADEFIRGKTLPENCHFLIDPDYEFVNAYNLRWDAPRETAYPATFVIDKDKRVRYAKISMTHGGRSKAAEVLEELKKLK